MAARIVGLDIGTDTLRAVELENATKPRPTVVRYHEMALPVGAVVVGEVREVSTVTAAIRRLWSTGGFTSKNVVLGLANQRVLVRDLTLPKMSIEQIRESLPFQVQEMLPVPVNQALLDFYPIAETTTDAGNTVSGLLIAAIKESVLANVNAVKDAGLTPVNVDLIPFALARVLVRGQLAQATVALIDVGASTTNVVVSSASVPQFVRMIPAGGDTITEAISERMNISIAEAEAVKRQRGLDPSPPTSEADQNLLETLFASTHELLNSLRNTLAFYSSTRPNDPIQAIVLTGGSAYLPGFARALGDLTRVQIIEANAFSTVDMAKSAKKNSGNPLSMTVALGLAIGSAA